MNAQITEVKITMADNSTKRIPVDENGMILVIGSGPYAGGFRVKLEDATQAELEAAEGEIETFIPFDEKLAAANEELKKSFYYNYFEAAVKFLTDLNADEFLELVLFAEGHQNKFPKFCSELRNIINANDAWGSAWSKMLAPLNKEMRDLGHKLLDNCLMDDAEGYDLEMFYGFYDAVSTIARIKEVRK